ncbi:YqaA family protein [Glacieibacterium sp.]|uniref:YqaA family protein n=1 Tax=Glacieibacterium sp. TaxID=2860237 RepID=UPI003B00F66C
MLRRLYDWMLRLAGRPTAERWLAFVSFADSSFFPLPPDIMLVPMCMAKPERAYRSALICTVASVLGALLGYAIGSLLFDLIGVPLLHFYGYEDKFHRFAADIGASGFIWMLAFAFLPIPYKVATIAAGSIHLDLGVVVLASILGRGGRFFAVAWVIRRYGVVAQRMIDQHFEKLAIFFTILFVGGFVVVKYAL